MPHCRLLLLIAACSVSLLVAAAAPEEAWEEGQSGAPPSPLAAERPMPASCSRASSRAAKKIFASYLDVVYGDMGGQMRALANASLLLSAACPFGGGNSMFDEQEGLKKQHRYRRCPAAVA
jgi:hypothetical protein